MTTAYNRRKGAGYELDLVKHFRQEGLDAERLRLTGRLDEGDVVLKVAGEPFVIEAKNAKSLDLGGWCKEAAVEAENFGRAREIHVPHFAVVHKRRNHPIRDSYVTMPLWEYLAQLRPEPF